MKNVTYVEALNVPAGPDVPISLFLAGGITDVWDWQSTMVDLLDQRLTLPLTVLNPRRRVWPIHDPDAARSQIMWEHRQLQDAAAISFWFAEETVQPITLYELGAWSMAPSVLIFVGCHPNYSRRLDVVIQTELVRPTVKIVDSIPELVDQVVAWRAARWI